MGGLANELAKILVRDRIVMALIRTFAIVMAGREVRHDLKLESTVIIHSPPSYGSRIFLFKNKKDRSKPSRKKSSKTCHRRKSTRAPPVADKWS